MSIIGVAVALFATVALCGAVIASLRGTSAPRVGYEPPEGVPVRVLCPASGGAAVVRLAISVAKPACVVVACDRFPNGVFQCDRECFPLDLMRRRPFGLASRV